MAMLRSLNTDGTTVIMVTHSEHDAKYASRVIRLFDGQIIVDQASDVVREVQHA